jgi:hypothetical protein
MSSIIGAFVSFQYGMYGCEKTCCINMQLVTDFYPREVNRGGMMYEIVFEMRDGGKREVGFDTDENVKRAYAKIKRIYANEFHL